MRHALRCAIGCAAAVTLLFLIEVQHGGLLLASSTGCTQQASRRATSDKFGSLAPRPEARDVEPVHRPPRRPCGQSRGRRYLLDATKLPTGLPGTPDEPLHLTFATASVDELLRNWAAHMRKLHLPAVVAAMDRWVLQRCGALRVHCLPSTNADLDAAMSAEAAKHGQRDASYVNVRGNPTLFISLGERKVGAILTLLHASGRAVVVSDVDVAWLHNPAELLAGRMQGYEDFAHADVLLSTDCLDPELDVKDHGCFHVLQDRNTGVLMVRNTTNARAVMLEWQARTGGAFQAWETDQTAFDDLLRGRGRGHRRNMTSVQRQQWFEMKKEWCGLEGGLSEALTMGTVSDLDGRHTRDSRRLFDVCVPLVARALRFGLLPLAYVANGHSFFVQQLQLQTGIWPYAVHATYQFEDQLDCAFGKRERMREWGIWLSDDDDDDDATSAGDREAQVVVESDMGCDGQEMPTAENAAPWRLPVQRRGEAFLVLEDDADLAPSVPWQTSDPHARGRQHVEHLDRFRQRLADGVLLAKALNRTVVLPPFYCYCDKYWARLTRCTIGQQALATQPLPFRCPMDHVVPISNWHGSTAQRKTMARCALPQRADGPPEHGMPYRTHAWLHQARASPHLAHVSGTLVPASNEGAMRASADDARAMLASPGHGGELVRGRAVPLPPNSSDAELRQIAVRDERGAFTGVGSNWARQPILKVSLSAARQILGCVTHHADAQALLVRLFQVRWCWRPEEMTEPRVDPDTNQTIDVCVWGMKTPTPPPRCKSKP